MSSFSFWFIYEKTHLWLRLPLPKSVSIALFGVVATLCNFLLLLRFIGGFFTLGFSIWSFILVFHPVFESLIFRFSGFGFPNTSDAIAETISFFWVFLGSKSLETVKAYSNFFVHLFIFHVNSKARSATNFICLRFCTVHLFIPKFRVILPIFPIWKHIPMGLNHRLRGTI